MDTVHKIAFPYFLNHSSPEKRDTVIFFGTDYYNLPIGSNHQKFIEATNAMLAYIRKNFPGKKYIYQPHPNEKDEYTFLNLSGFTVGEKTVAELLMYKDAEKIDYVFSACSGACLSAYAMGFDAAIFLDPLRGSVSEETLTGYKSYFAGVPDHFFIQSFDQKLPRRKSVETNDEKKILERIMTSIGKAPSVSFLVGDPNAVIKASILARTVKKTLPETKTQVILFQNRRWDVVSASGIFSAFDIVTKVARPGIRYSARPNKIIAALKMSRYIKQLPIAENSTIVSFSNMIFEENCILSNHPQSRKIGLIEERWYDFTFNGGYKAFPKNEFRESWGQKVFKYSIEPLLGLHATVFKEHKDGKVINLFRYEAPLEKIYDATFILMPSSQKNA